MAADEVRAHQSSLAGKAVIITGAGSGLGRAYAIAAAQAGASVVINDIGADACEQTIANITAVGGEAVAVVADVSQPHTGAALTEECLRRFGRIDGLVNNAGILSPGPAIEQTPETVSRMLAVNVAGVINCGTAAMSAMKQHGGGSIVNVVSGAAQGLQGLSLYGATKGAITSLTYGWALEARDFGVRVNAVSPLARTGMAMTTMSDDYTEDAGVAPSRITPAVLYLLGDRSRHLHGQILRFDGSSLALMQPPHLSRRIQRTEWDADTIADLIDGDLVDDIAAVGLIAGLTASSAAQRQEG